MLNKIKAICNFKNMSINEIEKINDNIFTIDNREYYVLTNIEAQEMYEEMEINLIEELGLEGFTEYAQEYIINNCLNMNWFYEVMNEGHEIYVEDMYEDELMEMFDTFNVDNKEDLIMELNNQYQNGLEYYREITNDRELLNIINKNNLMDIEKVVEFCQEVDGRGRIIASYDGIENEIDIEDTTYYIYRIN